MARLGQCPLWPDGDQIPHRIEMMRWARSGPCTNGTKAPIWSARGAKYERFRSKPTEYSLTGRTENPIMRRRCDFILAYKAAAVSLAR
jgi:hypothetical protein